MSLKSLNSAGFTLMEILLYTALAAIVGSLLVGIMVSSSGIFFRQNASVSHGVSLNEALNHITESVKQSSAVVSNYTNGSFSFTTNSSTIILTIPSIDSQSAIVANKFDYAVITQDPTDSYLLKKYLFPDQASSRSAEDSVLATTLSEIQFAYLDNSGNGVSPSSASRVRVTINLSERAGSSQKTASISGTINIKNN